MSFRQVGAIQKLIKIWLVRTRVSKSLLQCQLKLTFQLTFLYQVRNLNVSGVNSDRNWNFQTHGDQTVVLKFQTKNTKNNFSKLLFLKGFDCFDRDYKLCVLD